MHQATTSKTSSHFSPQKTPGRTEPKRLNGHKAQLALNREIAQLHRQLEHQQKLLTRQTQALHELENRLLSACADRDGWQRRTHTHLQFLTTLEQQLELSPARLSLEERHTRVLQALIERDLDESPLETQARAAVLLGYLP